MANLRKASPYKSALAERLARLKAQAAAAATIGLDSVVRVTGASGGASGPPDTSPKSPPPPRKRDTTSRIGPSAGGDSHPILLSISKIRQATNPMTQRNPTISKGVDLVIGLDLVRSFAPSGITSIFRGLLS